jgi:hypothetical protein
MSQKLSANEIDYGSRDAKSYSMKAILCTEF